MAVAALLAASCVAGCGGGSSASHQSTTAAAAPPVLDVAHARVILDGFLYGLDDPGSACRKWWVPTAQPACVRAAHRLKQILAKPAFALPPRGKLQYASGGVTGDTTGIVAGNRQPYPGSGSIFYQGFSLTRAGSEWKIVSVGTP